MARTKQEEIKEEAPKKINPCVCGNPRKPKAEDPEKPFICTNCN